MDTVRSGIDPLSQLLGSLSAQQATMTAQLAELRGDVLENRLKAEAHREKEIHAWESVQAEMRNVKHESRTFDQRVIALEHKIGRMDAQLTEWKIKLGLITTAAASVGGIIGFAIELIARLYLTRWLAGA